VYFCGNFRATGPERLILAHFRTAASRKARHLFSTGSSTG